MTAHDPASRGSDATRREVIVRATLAAATICGAAAVHPLLAQAAGGDAGVLEFVLRLELLQQSLYEHRAAELKLGPRAKSVAAALATQEQAHVDAVMSALSDVGATAPIQPVASFAAAHDESSFLRVAYDLEDIAVTAYNGLLPTLSSKIALAQMGTVLQVDARHAAQLAPLTHRSPTPYGAFDTPISSDAANGRVGRLMRP